MERPGNWSAPAWNPDGYGDHSVEASPQRRRRTQCASTWVAATSSMAQPLPELFELEPEDVHMRKVL